MMTKNRIREYTDFDDDSEKLINRENVWHFYAYFAGEAAQLLQEFLEIADIPEVSTRFIKVDDHPVEVVGREQFDEIMDAFGLLIDYYKGTTDHYYHESFEYNGREIDFERGDTIVSLLDSLHLFVNILPYLNRRHYVLSKGRYDEIRYHRFSFDELQHLDRTLAKAILPTFVWFAEHSIFSPQYFKRMFNYPKPSNKTDSSFWSYNQWSNALATMVTSWEWLKDRKNDGCKDGWEQVTDEIYYGLHLFAEYLPEMQND